MWLRSFGLGLFVASLVLAACNGVLGIDEPTIAYADGGDGAPTDQRASPKAISLTPSEVNAGSGGVILTVLGSGFLESSQITFDDDPVATTFVDARHLTTSLRSSRLKAAGTISVRIVDPGASSSPLVFTITNIAPAITSVTPASLFAGSDDRTVRITGTSFVAGSTVRSKGVLVSSKLVNDTTLTAVVPAAHVVAPGDVPITVTSPAPGGGTSAASNLVVSCDTTGTDILLGAIGNVTTILTTFASAPLLSRFANHAACNVAAVDPSAAPQPGRYFIVQNTASGPVTLSAWAVCTASGQNDDAYLTFYRRSTPPADDVERLACAFQIAEGRVSGYASPESGMSGFCPGLTKANGGGLKLGTCEKAVVHVQAYATDFPGYAPPPSIRLKPEAP